MAAACTSASFPHPCSDLNSCHWLAPGCPLIPPTPFSRPSPQVRHESRNSHRHYNSGMLATQYPKQMFGEALRRTSKLVLLPFRSHGEISSPECSSAGCHFRWQNNAVVGSGLLSSLGVFCLKTRGRRQQSTSARKSGSIAALPAGVMMAMNPLVDQVLLLGTVFGVYIAGVTSLPRFPFDRRASSSAQQDSPLKKQPALQQKTTTVNDGEGIWSQLHEKLAESMQQEEALAVDEAVVRSPILALEAVAWVPRLRLLLSILHHLQNEVMKIAEEDQYLQPFQWQELSLTVLSQLVEPVCRVWVSQEAVPNLYPRSRRAGTAVGKSDRSISPQRGSSTLTDNGKELKVVESMMDIMENSESISTYITRTGKAAVYADLIYFLRFGSVTSRCCCNHRIFRKQAGNLLEDMTVTMAEVVAALFLDCSSLTGLNPDGDMWQTVLLPSILSSRSLERFRNEVAMSRWVHQYFTSVTAMFEDRFELWTLQKRSVLAKKQKSKSRKTAKAMAEVDSPDLVFTLVQLPARRSRELKVLTGSRYYYSLFLEFSDVLRPLLGMLVSKLGDAVLFLLSLLLGKSLSLVYRGICDSLRWRKGDRSQKVKMARS